ncbi:GNAT family N-acetyltransferase [Breznakia sp. OttesenSCG-928-G09]|nr:GNAT family N-acetyltransferase [Breznakia sp. OttesenSCG-928-G09]
MKIRYAKRDDVKTILDLIIELAVYEKLEHEVVTDVETLEEWIFDKEKAKVLIGEVDNKVVGYCLYFYNFSTFHGKAGIYIEDIYVKKEHRGQGYGKLFFKKIAEIAEDEGCPRIEWSCLKWNKPSIDFYESLGAEAQNEWIGFRLSGDNIKKIAEK